MEEELSFLETFFTPIFSMILMVWLCFMGFNQIEKNYQYEKHEDNYIVSYNIKTDRGIHKVLEYREIGNCIVFTSNNRGNKVCGSYQIEEFHIDKEIGKEIID
jgi:hypothetical protein